MYWFSLPRFWSACLHSLWLTSREGRCAEIFEWGIGRTLQSRRVLQLNKVTTHIMLQRLSSGLFVRFHAALCRCLALNTQMFRHAKTHVLTTCVLHAHTQALKVLLRVDFKGCCVFSFPSLLFNLLMSYLSCKHFLHTSLSQFIIIPYTSKLKCPYL